MAKIKVHPEDFVVREIPAYEPSGSGDHLFVRFTKRNMTTDQAMSVMGRALGVKGRDVGAAGLKDRVGVTEQTISLPYRPGLEEAAMAFAHAPGDATGETIVVHDAKRHTNKLKTGHLRGNRFEIVVREVTAPDEALASFDRIRREGVPNAFGAQRFGRAGDNADRARMWLSGKAPAPRDPRMRRLLFSALQSAVFNGVLDRRIADGTWNKSLQGDLLKLHESGGLFLCTDVQADGPRADRGEVSPTGPLPGAKMREPEGIPRTIEQEIIREVVGDGFDWRSVAALGEGTRRVLRLWVEDLEVTQEQGDSIRVSFVLPKGAYATTVLGAAMVLDSASPGSGDSAETRDAPDVN